jgi:hypothetical protein
MTERNDNPEDLSYLEMPVDQMLSVREYHIVTVQDTENPPEFDVILDVTHMETGHQWRQDVSLGRDQFAQFVRMLNYAAETAGIEV